MNKSINYDFELNNNKEIAELIFNEINEEQSEEQSMKNISDIVIWGFGGYYVEKLYNTINFLL